MNKSIFLILLIPICVGSFSFIMSNNLDYIVEAASYNDSSTTVSNKPPNNDTEAMLQRGNIAMGFNQDKITHKFVPTVNGGEIIIMPVNTSDTNTLNQIRSMLKISKMTFQMVTLLPPSLFMQNKCLEQK